MVPMNFLQCWKAKLERPHFFKVRSGKITVWSEYFCKSLFRLKGLLNGKAPPHPDCFGNLVTPQVVLTTLKCFIRVKDVREYYEIPQKSKTIRGKVIYNHDLDPAEIIIAQVLIAKRDKVKFPLETNF